MDPIIQNEGEAAPVPLRLLLVDDEEKLLRGLSRGIAMLDADVEVLTATSGALGLQILAKRHVDAVVSDLYMPEMNGAEFLEKVHAHFPAVLRFVLTGEAKPVIFAQAARNAIQSFGKPCSASVVLDTIKASMGTIGKLRDPGVAQVVAQLSELPVCTAAMGVICRILDDPSADISDAVDAVARDPAMVSRLLRVANSPFFGRAGTVDTIEDAISVLGMDTVASMASCHKLLSKLTPSGDGWLPVDSLWEHSMRCSVLARTMGRSLRVPPRMGREATTAALLHDVGKMVLARSSPSSFRAAGLRSSADCIPLWQAEFPIFGNHHGEAGAALLRLWGLPEGIWRAVANHHTPHHEGATGPNVTALVHVADCLSHLNEKDAHPIHFDGPAMAAMELPDTLDGWAVHAEG